MYQRASWREKMENPNLPKVVKVPPNWRKRFGDATMLVPHPRDVEAAIRAVPRGRLITVKQIREYLAAKYQADVTCPLTTGIFIRIVAEAAEEEARAGKARITPYWRVVKDDGSLNPKFPGGLPTQAQRLRDEGQTVDTRHKIPRVLAGETNYAKLR